MTIYSSNLFNVTIQTIGDALSYIDTTTPDFALWKTWVDTAVADGVSPNGYAYAPYESAMMAKLSMERPELGYNTNAYANHAILMLEDYLSGEETRIASNTRPLIAYDSYLHVGPRMKTLALCYMWLPSYLTAGQKTRIENFAEQAVWNVWNASSASWGGNPHPWSGYATEAPGNNYFYSFMAATMRWAMASDSQTWKDFLDNVKWPQLQTYFNALVGGGSLEGTGYGLSHRELFDLYREWQTHYGYNVDITTHTLDSIDWWIHATCPSLDDVCPLGDQSRVSYPRMYDYYEHLMLAAVYLHYNSDAGKRGVWWLNNNATVQMYNGFNRQHGLLRNSAWVGVPPTALLHDASGTGHVFARTSWNSTATYMSFSCGKFAENHAHMDHGSFQIWKDEWQAVTSNIWSSSGLHGYISDDDGVESHNGLRFAVADVPLKQTFGSQSTRTINDDGDLVTINADLANSYSSRSEVTAWTRDFTFRRSTHTFTIHDLFTMTGGTTARFQLTTFRQPVVNSNVVTAGDLRMTIITPTNPTITLLYWPDHPDRNYSGGPEWNDGWQVQVDGGTNEYEVLIEILNGEVV